MITKKKFISITYNYIKFSPNKLNIFISQISQKTYKELNEILHLFPKKVSILSLQIINSNSCKIKKEKLIVIKIYINKGPILKRLQPRAKGHSFPIQKKMSHISIFICNIFNYILLKFIHFILLKF